MDACLFEVVSGHAFENEAQEGDYVLWEDYARLKAENEGLRSQHLGDISQLINNASQHDAMREELTNRSEKIRELNAKLGELRSQFANSEWQPIETAPKDGTWVLLWWKETPTGSECFDEWSPEQAVGKWHYDCWMRCSEYSVGGTPTHWMPLLKPPTK